MKMITSNFCLTFLLVILSHPYTVSPQTIKIEEETERKLDIKFYTVKSEREKEEIKLPARVSEHPDLVAEVHPPLSGIVKKLFVKEGDKVKKGAPLALIYSPQIAELQAQIRVIKVKMQTAQQTLEREETLYKEGVIPYARYYGAKIEYERIKGEYEALVENLKSFGEVVGDSILVRSPIEGYIAEQKVFTGSGVDTSKEMFKIHSHEKLWVYAYASPYEVEKIKKGMKGYVLWQGKKLEGIVDYISHEVDQNTKRVAVRILVENKNDILRPGVMTDALIELGEIKGIWIPAQAVQELRGDNVVFVKVPQGFEVRKVKVIKKIGDKILVEGLKEGEQIAITGIIFLKTQAEK